MVRACLRVCPCLYGYIYICLYVCLHIWVWKYVLDCISVFSRVFTQRSNLFVCDWKFISLFWTSPVFVREKCLSSIFAQSLPQRKRLLVATSMHQSISLYRNTLMFMCQLIRIDLPKILNKTWQKLIYIYLPTPLKEAECNTTSIYFYRSLTGLNLQISFILVGSHTMIKKPNPPLYLPKIDGGIIRIITFPSVWQQYQMQTHWARIWTWQSIFLSFSLESSWSKQTATIWSQLERNLVFPVTSYFH